MVHLRYYVCLYVCMCVCVYVCVCVCVCVGVTESRSVEFILIIRWCSSNLRQWPLQNLGSAAYCYISIIGPPCHLLLLFEVLSVRAPPYYPNTISADVRLISAQDHPTPRASLVSVPAYWYSRASASPLAVSNPPLPSPLSPAMPARFPFPPPPCCHLNLF